MKYPEEKYNRQKALCSLQIGNLTYDISKLPIGRITDSEQEAGVKKCVLISSH